MENRKSKNVLLAIMGVLIVAEIVAWIPTIPQNIFAGYLMFIALLFTALYGFILYKKPHGNMLKYAMLIFALANLIGGSYVLLLGHSYQIVRVIASAALCYSAGRLNRIDQNKYIMPIIGLMYLVVTMWPSRLASSTASVFGYIRAFNIAVNYITLMIAYFVRYKEHREAGLVDSQKN